MLVPLLLAYNISLICSKDDSALELGILITYNFLLENQISLRIELDTNTSKLNVNDVGFDILTSLTVQGSRLEGDVVTLLKFIQLSTGEATLVNSR